MDLLMDWLGQVEYTNTLNKKSEKDANDYCGYLLKEGITPIILMC